MKQISSIKEISDRYTHFIFDIWGVIHDGSNAYPGVVDVISSLYQQGKKICFLSNAPRRSVKVAETLTRFGIKPEFYDFIMTSGEASFLDLKSNQDGGFKKFGKKYAYIGPNKDMDLLDGLDYLRVDRISEASFVINTGFDHENSILAEKLPQIIEAKKYNLSMICVNPDMIVVKQSGHEMICAGALAAEYEKMNGEVIYYGKPFSQVYNITHQQFGSIEKTKIIAIGDGLETDIKGANLFGIDSVIVTGGILARELEVSYWQNADEARLKRLCDTFQIFPEFIISNLKS